MRIPTIARMYSDLMARDRRNPQADDRDVDRERARRHPRHGFRTVALGQWSRTIPKVEGTRPKVLGATLHEQRHLVRALSL